MDSKFVILNQKKTRSLGTAEFRRSARSEGGPLQLILPRPGGIHLGTVFIHTTIDGGVTTLVIVSF